MQVASIPIEKSKITAHLILPCSDAYTSKATQNFKLAIAFPSLLTTGIIIFHVIYCTFLKLDATINYPTSFKSCI